MSPRNRYSDRIAVGVDCSKWPSRTKQSFKESCDINNIIKSIDTGGLFRHLNEKMPEYSDLVHDDHIGTMSNDLQTALELVQRANESFAELPAVLRKRFDNDPRKFLAFVDDPANQAELVKLGLANPDLLPSNVPGKSPEPAPTAPQAPPKEAPPAPPGGTPPPAPAA